MAKKALTPDKFGDGRYALQAITQEALHYKRIAMIKALIASTILLLASCGQQSQESEEPEAQDTPRFELTYSDVMEFVRGVPGVYGLSGFFVDEPESFPSVDGLPEGATFDGQSISWTPSCDLKPENGQFIRGYMVYRIRINLVSATTDSIIQKPALIIVHLHGEESTCEES